MADLRTDKARKLVKPMQVYLRSKTMVVFIDLPEQYSFQTDLIYCKLHATFSAINRKGPKVVRFFQFCCRDKGHNAQKMKFYNKDFFQ